MPRFLLQHHHEPNECGAVYAAWKGFDSPLRHVATLASCLQGGHAIWWEVEAPDGCEALALLPRYIATRTTALAVSEVEIP